MTLSRSMRSEEMVILRSVATKNLQSVSASCGHSLQTIRRYGLRGGSGLAGAAPHGDTAG